MKNRRVSGYKNHRKIPAHEYSSTYTENGKKFGTVTGQASQAEGMEREQHVPKKQVLFRTIRVRRRG